MYEDLVSDVRSRVAAGEVVIVAGAGVSAAATDGAPAASWLGLLRAGVDHVTATVPGVEGTWAPVMSGLLELGDLTSLLSVAEQVTSRLGGREGGEYARFLAESVGGLELVDRRVPAALVSWGVPVATTNYDGLIEAASGWGWATWRDVGRLQRVLLGGESVVAHLHGFWDDAASVVLGVRSYDELVGAPGARGLQQALMATRTLVFVGMGAGADDLNWGPLRRWAAGTFGSQQHRHYRLCTTSEVEGLTRVHAGERIVPLPYGDRHDELAAFLENIAPPRPTGRVRPGTQARRVAGVGLPAPRRTFGRDAETADLVGVVLDEEAGPALVLGPPGVGKTNLTLAVLHSPVVVEAFGPRRFWLRCDAITDPAELAGDLATALGAPASRGDAMASAVALLAEAPSLVVLDNAETPWEADPLAAEAFLEALAAVPGARMVASLRGSERPGGPTWARPLRLAPLVGPAARELFVSIAGDRFAADGLDGFLDEMGGLPLAIELLAYVAETEDNLEALIGRWRQERSTILARAGGLERSLSIGASFEVSWSSTLLTDPARRLLSLLGALPDGIAHDDLDALLHGEGPTAAAVARRRALAFDETGRLRTHPPLRHHLDTQHPPDSNDLDRAWQHYIDLTVRHGSTVGNPGGQQAATRLLADSANIAAAFAAILTSNDPSRALNALGPLANFARHSGIDATATLEHAITAADTHGDTSTQAQAREEFADVALRRSDHDGARARYDEALALYRQVGDVLGEANCIMSLGDIALERSDHDGARARYDKAFPLYRQVGDVLGEANCIKSLGDIALRRSDHDGARARYDEALPLYRQVGDVLGEANCIKNLGDIALRRSDHDGARVRYDEALPLYRQVGVVLGEANCISRLGDIALRRSDHDGARARYDEALPLYRQVGAVLGEANCIKSLGDIALERSDHDGARARYDMALALYCQVGDVLGEANCIKSLGDIALRRSDHDGARVRYDEALPLYRQVGAVLGEANCIKSLGDIALERSDHDGARARYDEALGLYEQIQEPYSVGQTHRRLAQLASESDDRQHHVDAARQAWTRIHREDLIIRLDQEFPQPA